MKKVIYFAALAVLLITTACSQHKYEVVPGDPTKTRIYTLDNGLKVYLSVNKKEPRIQTCIAVNVGSKNDPAETTGLAHYFEHLMFKGTEQFGTTDYAAEKPMLDQIEQLFETYRTTQDSLERAAIYKQIDSISYEASKLAIPNEYDKLMSVIGATGTNAFTSSDMTVYIEDIPSNQIDNWARIQADRFMNPVIRLFHTELETIYEEKNMSLTDDNDKVMFALDQTLFANHPYGRQTVLGSQEDLKNPSITNVRNYHKTYYVPNNMAICMSGDFNPNEAIRVIEKYFGKMKPNTDLPKLEYEKEKPLSSPVVKEVNGLEAENITLAWRLPAAKDTSNDIAQMASYILYNGVAGLIDLDLVQNQKVLSAYNFAYLRPDYGSFIMNGRPKAGQTLDEVRQLLLDEVGKLRDGDFDEGLIEATVNNMKLMMINQNEDNYDRAMSQVYSFINGTEWKDEVQTLDRMARVTKADIMQWADEFLPDDGYVAIYKRMGKDENIQKISAPQITPIATNRDEQSKFLKEIKETPVKAIEPVFVNYDKDMQQLKAKSDINVLYKQNTTNDLASITYVFDKGTADDPALYLAFYYLKYLGTDEMSNEDISREMYRLACNSQTSVLNNETYITISGLEENLTKAMDIVEDQIKGAIADESILTNLKKDLIKSRNDAKLNQQLCFGRLTTYTLIGSDFIKKSNLTNEQLMGLTSSQLLGKVRELMDKQHEILYYGPADSQTLLADIAQHHYIADNPGPLTKSHQDYRTQGERSKVFVTEYDANQIYYLQYSNRGEKFDLDAQPYINMYNSYFGEGMNSIVFQEMREARGLAYTASAWLSRPADLKDPYSYIAFIATQNDKMQQAIEAFENIINDMPESQAAFNIAKESTLTKLCTSRVIGADVLWSFREARDLGLTEPMEKQLYEKVQGMTLDDVVKTQQQWVKDRTFDYAILGRTKDLDMDYLHTLGDVQSVSLTDIFGY